MIGYHIELKVAIASLEIIVILYTAFKMCQFTEYLSYGLLAEYNLVTKTRLMVLIMLIVSIQPYIIQEIVTLIDH